MSIQQKTREVILKLKAVKEDRGLSLQRILDMVLANGGNISMSSVRKVFSEGSENMVFRYEDTIKPIADVLLAVGENVSSDFEPDETETEALRSVIRLKNSIIRELREEIEHSNEKISDCPIIRSMERTGYPPWIDPDYEEPEEEEDEEWESQY